MVSQEYIKALKLEYVTSCPECGSTEYVNKDLIGEGYRCCRNCDQDWWTDVKYDMTHKKENENGSNETNHTEAAEIGSNNQSPDSTKGKSGDSSTSKKL